MVRRRLNPETVRLVLRETDKAMDRLIVWTARIAGTVFAVVVVVLALRCVAS